MVGAPGGRVSTRSLLVVSAKVFGPALFTAGFRTRAFAAWQGAREVVGGTSITRPVRWGSNGSLLGPRGQTACARAGARAWPGHKVGGRGERDEGGTISGVPLRYGMVLGVPALSDS